LALGFDAKMGAALREGDLDLPAARRTIAMISAGASVVSVLKNAWEARFPAGSRTRTHRIGRGGVPRRYHKAVPLVISRGFSVCWA
jgi:hypothetical protein